MPKSHTPFAVFNRVGNPAVKLLLRSPLHRVASGQLALVTVTGRRSGRTYTIPVGYRREGDVVTIGVGWPERKRWWRNLRDDGAPVRMHIAGRDYSGRGVARGDEDRGVAVEVTLD